MQHEGAVHIDEIKEELEQIEAKTEQEESETETKKEVENESVKSETEKSDPGENESETGTDTSNDRKVRDVGEESSQETGGETTVVEKVHKVKIQPDESYQERLQEKQKNPPESIFNRLRPSRDRYTILERDEL